MGINSRYLHNKLVTAQHEKLVTEHYNKLVIGRTAVQE